MILDFKQTVVKYSRLQDLQCAIFNREGTVFGKVEIPVKNPLQNPEDLALAHNSVLNHWAESIELGGVAQYSLRQEGLGMVTKPLVWYDASAATPLEALCGFLMVGKTFRDLDDVADCVEQVDRAHEGLRVFGLGYRAIFARHGQVQVASWGPTCSFDRSLLQAEGSLSTRDHRLFFRYDMPKPERELNVPIYG